MKWGQCLKVESSQHAVVRFQSVLCISFCPVGIKTVCCWLLTSSTLQPRTLAMELPSGSTTLFKNVTVSSNDGGLFVAGLAAAGSLVCPTAVLSSSGSSGRARVLETTDGSIGFTSLMGIAKFRFSPPLIPRSRDADDFPCHVEQRAAAAAGGYRRSDLHKFAPFVLDGSDRADNAIRNRRFERKRIANRNNFLSDLELDQNRRE